MKDRTIIYGALLAAAVLYLHAKQARAANQIREIDPASLPGKIATADDLFLAQGRLDIDTGDGELRALPSFETGLR